MYLSDRTYFKFLFQNVKVDSEIQRRATETLMNNSRVPFSKTQEQNQENLKGIVTQIENLEDKIPDLNKQVCRTL